MDSLLTPLPAYHHAVAPAGGTFSLRGALNLNRRRQSRVPASYSSNPPTFPGELSGLANIRPTFPSNSSTLPPLADHSRGGDGAPSLKGQRGPNSLSPHVSVEPSDPHLYVSCSPCLFCPSDRTFWRGDGASPPRTTGRGPKCPALPIRRCKPASFVPLSSPPHLFSPPDG